MIAEVAATNEVAYLPLHERQIEELRQADPPPISYREVTPAGVCPRCLHVAHLNTDGLCKPCLRAIRAEDDAEWALAIPGSRPRDLQLTIGTWRDYPDARPSLISCAEKVRAATATELDWAGLELVPAGQRWRSAGTGSVSGRKAGRASLKWSYATCAAARTSS
jgi:hypothetical protein